MKMEKNGWIKPFVICMIMMGLLILGSVVNVVADEPPVADADPDHQTVSVGEEAYFTGSNSYDRDGYIVSYHWIFGDGLVYEGENMTYTFNAVGNFTVSLTVTDNCGNQDTDYITVNVVEHPPSEPLMVWIESLATDKEEYNVNETIYTTACVQRSNDMLTYVWEGALVLEVLDQSFFIIYTEERPVYLPQGGSSETYEFEFILAESGDYFIRASLYDFHDELIDVKEVIITVSDDGSGGGGTKPPNDEERLVWIESLTTDKDEYDVNDDVKTEIVIKRGNDSMDYVWKGILILEVFDEAMALVYAEEQEVTIPCDGWTQTLNFEFTVTSPGDHLVKATLYDIHDELMDIKEIYITVIDDNSGGTKPPNMGCKFVWIESLITDQVVYDINELVMTQVTVKRGNDMLTFVWTGTLVLEVFNDSLALVHTDSHDVYLPSGGMKETHRFDYRLAEPGSYLIKATLYDFEDNLVDNMETAICVCENAGGIPGKEDPKLSDNDNMGISASDKGSIFQAGSSTQIALLSVVITALLALSAFVVIRVLKGPKNKKEKS